MTDKEKLEAWPSPRPGDGPGMPGSGPEPIPVHQAGGDLVNRLLVQDGVRPFEQLNSVIPQESWFSPDVSPQRPVQFEIGFYSVPKSSVLWVLEYNFSPYRFSGMDAGDTVPLEEGRLRSVLGYDVQVANQRNATLMYQLDPVPVALGRRSFGPPVPVKAPPASFSQAAYSSFATQSSQGTSLLPARKERQGAWTAPWMWAVKSEQVISFSVVIFRRIPMPLGSIDVRFAGFLVPQGVHDTLMRRLRVR